MDPMISEQMEANLRSKGIEVHCNVQVMEIKDRGNDTVSVNYRCERGWKESPGGPRAGGSRQTPEYVEGSGGRLSGTAGKWASAHQGNLPHDAGKCLCDRRYRGAETSCPCGSVHAAYLVENLADADTGCSFRSCRTVCMSCFRLCRPVFIRSREIAAVGLNENERRLYNMKIKCGVAYMTGKWKSASGEKQPRFCAPDF